MAFRVGLSLILLCVAFAILNVSVVEGNCYRTWSRCSRWSSGFTGTLWKSCNDRCIEQRYSGGSCQYCSSDCWLSSKAWKCICYGAPSCN